LLHYLFGILFLHTSERYWSFTPIQNKRRI